MHLTPCQLQLHGGKFVPCARDGKEGSLRPALARDMARSRRSFYYLPVWLLDLIIGAADAFRAWQCNRIPRLRNVSSGLKKNFQAFFRFNLDSEKFPSLFF
jgi:hypothetical protein